ncbi:MAG: hypothetical protein ABI222_00885 [Opitutaceae bacterium]
MTKPRKVEEPVTPYTATAKSGVKKQPKVVKADAAPQIRYIDDKTFRKATDKIFKVHEELFRKLAQ